MKSKLAAAAGLLVAWSAAHGDTITFTFNFDKSVLQPGDVQKISVWADLDPSVGQTTLFQGAVSTVAAFGAASFDLINLLNAQTGEYSNFATNPGFSGWPYSQGWPDGQGNVQAVSVGQLTKPVPLLVADDPVMIWQATWAPYDYTPRTVELDMLLDPLAPPHVLVDLLAIPLGVIWDGVTIPNSFEIVPAPGALPLLGVGVLYALRRRRR